MISHGPDGVDDNAIVMRAVNPLAVVRDVAIEISQPRPLHGCDHGLPVALYYILIEIFGVSKLPGVDAQGQCASQGERDLRGANFLNHAAIHLPLFDRYDLL